MQTTQISQRQSPHSLDLLTRQTASTFISIYQKQISPRKGFSCAYRVLHRSESCSQYTKRVISEFGIGQAIPLIRQRFQACKAANQTLKAQGCRFTKQQETATMSPAIALQDTQSTELVSQPWSAIEDVPLDEPIEPPDENANPDGERSQQKGRSIGGGGFRKPPVANSADSTGTTNQNNSSDWNCDSINCTSLGCDTIDCASTDCSGMDCGVSDWQGLDCNGLDCNGADCGNLDCGSCDVGSCDCSA
ncbi:MAG: membrane protein insertion efficiency factor YidD [Stenomitos rutilans HA7619-LM2]|jgi:putative component of membrane protein insertase Oxa1/YidC/SpoIIIJ protein YidD|nr:membrane protein insertion efficiency factor YidD [Stenomitos rutilans HA7619-LM2]